MAALKTLLCCREKGTSLSSLVDSRSVPKCKYLLYTHIHTRRVSTIEVAGIFPLDFSLNDGGLLNPKNRRNANLVSKNIVFCILGPWEYSSGCNMIFAEVSFRVGYGAP